MSDYRDRVKSEAKKFFDGNWAAYEADSGEFGGKSKLPNFSKWIDRTKKLNAVVESIAKGWGKKEMLWVQQNTKNWKVAGGDPRSTAYGAFYTDIFHEAKKLSKK